MHRTPWAALCVSIFVFLGLSANARAEKMVYARFTIKNETGNNATDLHLEFYSPLGAIKIRPTVQPPGKTATGTINPADNKKADFPEDSFGTIKPGDTAFIDYCAAPPIPRLRSNAAYWTLFGENVGPVTRLPNSMIEVTEPTFRKASLDITNSDSSSLQYTNVAVYADNDLANFNLDDFATPTGTLVAGVPASFVLAPGESVSFPLGTVDPTQSYLVALAQVSLVSQPEFIYDLAATNAVPEPPTRLLASLGAVSLLFIARRRRRR